MIKKWYEQRFATTLKVLAFALIGGSVLGVCGVASAYSAVDLRSVATGVGSTVETESPSMQDCAKYLKQDNGCETTPETEDTRNPFKTTPEGRESAGARPHDSLKNPSHDSDSCRKVLEKTDKGSCLNDVVYEIQPGDTLSSISQKFSISVDQLVKYNGINHPDWIYAHSSIRIPYTELKK